MFVNWNTWVTLKIGNIDRWTVSWIRLEMWRWGNWISCRKELDFIKPQRREHAILILMYKISKMTKSGKSLKSGEVSEMAVNWVRFPWCSAGPTSGDVISSNISRNHSTIPFSALLCKVQQCCTTPRPPPLLCNLQLYMNVALSTTKTSAYISVQIFLHTLTIFELKWAVSGYSKAVLVSTKLCWSHNAIFPQYNILKIYDLIWRV